MTLASAGTLLNAAGCLNVAENKNQPDQPKPNIIWMVSEDNGARWLHCYGNKQSKTPNLDQMAKDGFLYTNSYATVPVCAPQRFTWITGINAISAGTQNMRSGTEIPEHIKFYPEIFSELGYYTSKGNDAKTDYNYRGRDADATWDDNRTINWKNLKNNQPFFHVFNTHSSHEATIFGEFNPEKDEAPKADDLAAYHPDEPEIRFIYQKYRNAIARMDSEIGKWLSEIKENGLADNTIVIYNSDHGGTLARSKRFLYNSGTHAPLIVKIPPKYKNLYPAKNTGQKVDRLVSFTDFPKTWLSLAGAASKDLQQMQGNVFLGHGQEPEPDYIYSFRDRMDQRLDMARSSRDHKYLFIRNYMPFAPVGQFLDYLHNSVATRKWYELYLAGKTNDITGRFFKQPRDVDELYDYNGDYDNVINLADNKKYRSQKKKMLQAVKKWQLEIFDTGFLPEEIINPEIKKHDLTVYDYVRTPKLYPLQRYIDAADLSLEMNPKNMPKFINSLNDEYVGIRYWSLLGIINLTFFAEMNDKKAAIDALRKFIAQEESTACTAFASWAMVRLGDEKEGFKYFENNKADINKGCIYINILDWMQHPHKLDIARQIYYSDLTINNTMTHKILVNMLKISSSPEELELIEQKEKQRGN